jgi:hypothetical protein
MAADRGGVAVGRVEYQRREVARQPVRLAPRPVFLAGREGLPLTEHTDFAPAPMSTMFGWQVTLGRGGVGAVGLLGVAR